tara:strand:- start:237 stop:479 length:243 start_codon:yes stop_codon:yes gene_type:complete
VKVVVKLREVEDFFKVENVEAVDPIGLPGFVSIIQHNMENPDEHTSYVWPSMSIEHMIIETFEGERFEHTTTPRWFKQMP